MKRPGRRINVDGVRVEGVANRQILRDAFKEAARQTGVSIKLVTIVTMAIGGLLGGGMTLVLVPLFRVWSGVSDALLIVGAIVGVLLVTRFVAQRLLWWVYRKEIRLAMQRLGYELCVECGYWLKGIPDGQPRCPECGAQRRTLGGVDE